MQNTTTYITQQHARKPRLDYIDLAKGVCIILVVILHCNVALPYPVLRNLRMPLYFVLSGLFFKDYGGLIPSLVQKANKLLVPFIVFTIGTSILLHGLSLVGYLRPIKPGDPLDIIAGRDLLNVPMWFLLCLFIDYLLFYIITHITADRRLQICLIITLAGIGWLMSINHIQPPYFLDAALTALPYYYLGYAMRHTTLLTAPRHWLHTALAIAAIPLAAWLSDTLDHPQIDFMVNKMNGNPINSAIISALMVIAILLICKAIRRLPIISYLGRYSIITLCLHYPLMIILVNLQRHLHIIWDKWYTVLLILTISLCLTPLLTRHLPKLTAQQNLFAIPQPYSLRLAIKNRLTKTRIFQKTR